MIWISILLWAVLIVANIVVSGTWYIIIWYWSSGEVAFVWIIIWIILGFWINWFLNKKKYENYEDNDWVEF